VAVPGSSLFFQAGSVALPVMAERLKASHLLVGSIRQTRDALHVTARLFNVKSDKELWSEAFATTALELSATRDQIPQAAISAMNLAGHSEPVLQAALALQPGAADVLSNASDNEFTFGRFEQAIELLQAAIDRDPITLPLLLRLGLLHEFAGDYEQSLIAYRQLLGLNPDYPAAHAYRARVKLAQGKAESALKEADLEPDPFWQNHSRILALIALEGHEEADLLLGQMTTEHAGDAAFQLAEIHAFRGDTEGAFDWLEQAWR